MSKKMNSGLAKFVFGIFVVAVLCIGCDGERQRDSHAGMYLDAIPIEVKNAFPQISAPVSADALEQEMPAQFSSRGFYLLPGQLRMSDTSGEELYLLANSNYVHVGWADIHPATVHETGSWKIANGMVELTALHTCKWTRMTDRKFIGMFFPVEGKRVLLLMGNRSDISRFKEQQGSKNDFDLFLNCMSSVRHLSPAQSDYLGKCKPEQEIPYEFVSWEKPKDVKQ